MRYADIHFIRQKELKGLGNAIYYVRLHAGNELFAVLMGDTIIDAVIPVTQQLIDIYEQYRQSILACVMVPQEKVSGYGLIGGVKISDRLWDVNDLVEKGDACPSPSNLAIAGRDILTPEIFKTIEPTTQGQGNEMLLTDALRLLLKRKRIRAYVIGGKRYDIGNKLDYLKTEGEFGLQQKEFAGPFRKFLREIRAKGTK